MQCRHARLWRENGSLPPPRDLPAPQSSVSVVVAARNEAENLPDLLAALTAGQTRVPDEILVVDDHSTDQSRELVLAYQDRGVYGLCSEGHGKRAALRSGCAMARGDILLFTDADCRPGPGWVEALSGMISSGEARFVAGPVLVRDGASLLCRYDALESQGMMVVIAAGYLEGAPVLAQGASMGLRRQDLLDAGGFTALPDRASGDDVFLMERFREHWPGACRFVARRDALVWTGAPPDWRGLLRQRLRWASKSGAIRSARARASMILVFLSSMGMLLYLAGLPWWPNTLRLWGGVAVLLKVWGDLLVLRAGWIFGGQPDTRRILPLAMVIHPLLVVYAGLLGPLQRQYIWKGRKVR